MSHTGTRNKSDISALNRLASLPFDARLTGTLAASSLFMTSPSVGKLALHHDSRQAKHAQQYANENQELALPWIDLPFSIEIVGP